MMWSSIIIIFDNNYQSVVSGMTAIGCLLLLATGRGHNRYHLYAHKADYVAAALSLDWDVSRIRIAPGVQSAAYRHYYGLSLTNRKLYRNVTLIGVGLARWLFAQSGSQAHPRHH